MGRLDHAYVFRSSYIFLFFFARLVIRFPAMKQTTLIDFDEILDARSLVDRAREIVSELAKLSTEARIGAINEIRKAIHEVSPFKSEPVDCVQWIHSDEVAANDYNPNSVAPPEMKLLEHSITEDGYTQPIVAWLNGSKYEVVDGFHRNRVGRESKAIQKRLSGYLPLTIINDERLDRSDRIASTIRHNRARGKHKVEAMSDIVVELKRRNWSDEKIAKELGMDPDEVLRLTQITGLAELFANQDFSSSWEVDGVDDDQIDVSLLEEAGVQE